MLALMVFLVSLACTNVDQVAYASTAARASDAAPGGRSAVFELTPESAQYHQTVEAPPDRDGKALEPAGGEVSVGGQHAVVVLTVDVAPILPFLSPTQHVGATVVWLAECLASSLFPRGPPTSIA